MNFSQTLDKRTDKEYNKSNKTRKDKRMKKFVKALCSVLFAVFTLFACVGCDGETEEVKCAPCTVHEIWSWNETVLKEFFVVRTSTAREMDGAVKCTVNGEEWDKIKRRTDELAEGKYKIVFYTPQGFTVQKMTPIDGEIVREDVPYERSVTISVTISSEYEDICDYEYRRENGLWTDPTKLEWYDAYSADPFQ